MAISNASSKKDLVGDEALQARTQAYHDWIEKKAEFDATNPSAEDRAKWVSDNPEYDEPHDCQACGGTGTIGGPPPKPLLRAGKEGIIERSAKTHSEIEIPPVEKTSKKDKTDTGDSK